MSEAPKSLLASTNHGKIGPDFFGYYTHEIVELLSQDEDVLPSTSQTSDMTGRKCGDVRGKGAIENKSNVVGTFFENSIGAGVSDFKKDRLKSLLREAAFSLTAEVDEMLDPVMAMCQLQSKLRSKKNLSSDNGAALNGDTGGKVPNKKLKMSSSSSASISANASPLNCGSCREGSGIGADKEDGEGEDDLQFLLENNSMKVEETTKKYSDELTATLGHMEQQLEEILDAVVSKCRPMTRTEKQELRKLIQKLPPKNLDRVVEIVNCSKRAEKKSSDEFVVDLEREDNVTLWRLYYYVQAVEKAKQLL